MKSRTAPQINWNTDFIMYIFTRVSGLFMILLGLIGITSAFALGARVQVDIGALARWTFFQNPNHVVNTNIPDVTLGWANAWWQVMQIMMFLFGLTHGMNGVRVVIEDYIGASWAKILLRGLLLLLWLFFIIVGIYVILAS
jgi:succinate dehydrogenase hydrophobic anchor subunit